jgi:NitT/TauT family transport system ATP-binding protein
MQAELLKIWSKSKKTGVFITHQIDEAVFLADRVEVLGTRPGCIKKEFPVAFDRPRGLSLKRDPKFLATCDDIWRLIEQESERINVLRAGD